MNIAMAIVALLVLSWCAYWMILGFCYGGRAVLTFEGRFTMLVAALGFVLAGLGVIEAWL